MKGVLAEFIKFPAVGTFGFLVDATILHVFVAVGGLGVYISRLFSYLAAATATWLLTAISRFEMEEAPTPGANGGDSSSSMDLATVSITALIPEDVEFDSFHGGKSACPDRRGAQRDVGHRA